jgi:hypothetical protein
MKSTIALLLLFTVGCAGRGELASLKSSLRISGETIVAKQDESLTILKENTTALAAIKDQIDTLKASQVESETDNGIGGDLESGCTSPDENANDSHPVTPAVAESGDVPLFVCSTANCSPCKRLWRDVDDGKLDGFDVRKAPPFDGLKSYPAIRFKNPDSDTGWSVVYGYDEETRLWLRAKLLGEKAVASNRVTYSPAAMSHGEMVALHNQLHGGGQWTWPGDLSKHLQSVHGVVMNGGEQPVSGSFFPVQGQSTVVNSRSAVRSNSWGSRFVGRSRTLSR